MAVSLFSPLLLAMVSEALPVSMATVKAVTLECDARAADVTAVKQAEQPRLSICSCTTVLPSLLGPGPCASLGAKAFTPRCRSCAHAHRNSGTRACATERDDAAPHCRHSQRRGRAILQAQALSSKQAASSTGRAGPNSVLKPAHLPDQNIHTNPQIGIIAARGEVT